MTRKQLPKAIRRTSDELHSSAAGIVTDDEAPAPQTASMRATSQPTTGEFFLPEPLASKRRSAARKIVERHRTYAAIGGLFPIPIVSIAGVTAITLRMVKQLSNLYGVPFRREQTRSTIISLIGGAVPTGLGAATTSTLAFVVPAGALVGLAVSAITAATLTRGIGLVFLDHFEHGAVPLGAAQAAPA